MSFSDVVGECYKKRSRSCDSHKRTRGRRRRDSWTEFNIAIKIRPRCTRLLVGEQCG